MAPPGVDLPQGRDHEEQQCQSLPGRGTCKYSKGETRLTLKAPITTAADDKFRDIFPNFQQ